MSSLRSTRPSIQLPPEISDQVIGFIGGDAQVLSACSLVCKPWLALSRPRFFRKVTVDSSNLDTFCSLVISAYSTLPDTIRTLRLVADPRDPLWFQRICPFIQLLERVRSITLENIDWCRVGSSFSRDNFIRSFRLSLSELILKNQTFESFADLSLFISQFSALHTLGLHSIAWFPISSLTRPVTLGRISAPLTKLAISDTGARHIVEWLLSQEDIPMVTSLALSAMSEQDLCHIGRYLVFLGSSLSDLRMSLRMGPIPYCIDDRILDYFPAPGVPPPPTQAKLNEIRLLEERYGSVEAELARLDGGGICQSTASLTSLTTVFFEDFLFDPTGPRDINGRSVSITPAALWAPKLLRSIKSPALRKVVFGVRLSNTSGFDAVPVNWQLLDRILTEGRKERVKEVEIRHEGSLKPDVLIDLISARWPRCAAQGKLVFTHVVGQQK